MHRSMYATALTLALLAGSGIQAGEDHRGQGGEHGGDRLARMQQHLGLTEEQVSQIREIRARGGSRDDIRQVLTDDQRAQLEEHRARRQQKHREQQRARSEY